jgi:hypothetical protein
MPTTAAPIANITPSTFKTIDKSAQSSASAFAFAILA